jgi:hypothetical protein
MDLEEEIARATTFELKDEKPVIFTFYVKDTGINKKNIPMRNYQTIRVNGRQHVICSTESRVNVHGTKFADANYMNTKKALCGVLGKNETLAVWIDGKLNRIKKYTKKAKR